MPYYQEYAESFVSVDSESYDSYSVVVVASSDFSIVPELFELGTHTELVESAVACGFSVLPMLIYGIPVDESVFVIDSFDELFDSEFQTYAFNTTSFYCSVYSGYNFNSYAVDGSSVLAVSSDGVYIIGGDTDAGNAIHPGIIFSRQTFGSAHKKKFRQFFFGGSGDDVSIMVATDSGSFTSPLVSGKVNIPRTMIGRTWEFRLSGFSEFDFIEVFPITRTR